jgi:hypothetical protein
MTVAEARHYAKLLRREEADPSTSARSREIWGTRAKYHEDLADDKFALKLPHKAGDPRRANRGRRRSNHHLKPGLRTTVGSEGAVILRPLKDDKYVVKVFRGRGRKKNPGKYVGLAAEFAALQVGDRVHVKTDAGYGKISPTAVYTVNHAGVMSAILKGTRGGKLTLVVNQHDPRAIFAIGPGGKFSEQVVALPLAARRNGRGSQFIPGDMIRSNPKLHSGGSDKGDLGDVSRWIVKLTPSNLKLHHVWDHDRAELHLASRSWGGGRVTVRQGPGASFVVSTAGYDDARGAPSAKVAARLAVLRAVRLTLNTPLRLNPSRSRLRNTHETLYDVETDLKRSWSPVLPDLRVQRTPSRLTAAIGHTSGYRLGAVPHDKFAAAARVHVFSHPGGFVVRVQGEDGIVEHERHASTSLEAVDAIKGIFRVPRSAR